MVHIQFYFEKNSVVEFFFWLDELGLGSLSRQPITHFFIEDSFSTSKLGVLTKWYKQISLKLIKVQTKLCLRKMF